MPRARSGTTIVDGGLEAKLPWDSFFRTAWGRSPAVFTGVLERPLLTQAEAFRALRAAVHDRPGVTPRTPTLRIYDGREPVPPDDRLLPAPSDGSVRGYLARLDAELGEPGIVVNHFQAGSPGAWRCTTAFLDAIYSRLGAPPFGALLDLFSGSYRRSFLAVHKDDQDVFTFVLEGRKRFLVWPFEALAARFGVASSRRRLPVLLPKAEVDALRDSAVVLEGGPRDILYWPADHWHVAESEGEHVTTFALGVCRRESGIGLVGSALAHLVDENRRASAEGFPLSSPTLPYRTGPRDRARTRREQERLARRVLSSADLQRAMALTWEARVSGMGYGRVPPRDPTQAVGPEDVVQVTDPHAIRLLEGEGELHAFAGGHTLPLASHPKLRALVRELQRGGELSVADLTARVCRGDSARVPGIEPEVVTHLLGWFAGSHVLARKPRSRSRAT